MPIRVLEQIAGLKMLLFIGALIDLAAAPIDLFSADPVTGNQAFLILVGGALCGAFMSAMGGEVTSTTTRMWTSRIFLATITSISFTPFIMTMAKIPNNSATVLAVSAIVALGAKLVIRWAHNKLLSWLGTGKDRHDDPPAD